MKVLKLAQAIATDGKTKIFRKVNKLATDAMVSATGSAHKSVVDPAFYQAVNGIQLPKAVREAIEQSRLYREQNFIPSSQRILDGFKDGGSNARYLDNGSVVDSTREIIVVDRAKDSRLSSIVSDFEAEFADVDTREVLPSDFTQKYVFERFARKTFDAPEFIEYPVGSEMYLGEILENGTPTCRHLALLYKILGDDIGLETDLVRGMASFNGHTGKHAWNIITEDGCTGIVDAANNIMTGYPENVVNSVFGQTYCKYIMPCGFSYD